VGRRKHDPLGLSSVRLQFIAVVPARVIRSVTWAECAIGTILALIALGGGVTGSIVLPVGLFGGLRLTLDAVSAWFLMVVCISGTAAATECETPLPPLVIGALAVTLLAADGFTLVLGYSLASIALWASERQPRSGLHHTIGSILGLVAAVALLAPPNSGTDLSFATIRGAPPEGTRAAFVLLLVLLAAGLRVVWPVRSGSGSALLAHSMFAVAIYLLVRVLFDLCGDSPGWWGLPLVFLGAAAMVLGGLRANAADDLLAVLAASRMGAAGLIAVGLGIALAARGSDLAPLSALALAGALLHAASYIVFDTLLMLCAAALVRSTGISALSQLGGLIRRMPAISLAALVGVACLAGLPLTAGFPGRWLVLQSFWAAPRPGGFWLQAGLMLALAAVALGSALGAAAAVRLIGLGFLGRPRTPHAAAAEDAPRRVRLAVAGLAALCTLIGLFPSALLALLQRALAQLLGVRLDGGRLLVIAAQADAPGYAAPGVAAMLMLAGFAAARMLQRFANPVARLVPAWEGGRDAAPLCSTSNNAATQNSAVSAGQALLQSLGYRARSFGLGAWFKKTASLLLQRPAIAGLGGAFLLMLLGLLLWKAA